MERCAVIGGGIGGLTAALYLAGYGFETDLFEQQEYTGGKACEQISDGFRFDGGPTLLTMPFVIDRIADENNIPEEQKPRVSYLEETCRYFYPDGTVFRAFNEKRRLYEEVRKLMKDPPARMAEFLANSKEIYDLCSDLFLFSSFHEFDRLLEYRDRFSPLDVFSLDPFRTMHQSNKSYFKDKRLIQFADRYATYNGSSPYRVPATLNIIHHVEQLGASVPAEGISAIPAFLEKAATAKGVRIHKGCRVEKISLDNKEVNGIVIDKRKLPFNKVISNVDVSTTYIRLLRRNNCLDAMKYRMMTPSSSALVFYWGMKIEEDKLAIHNILFSDNYRKEFRELFSLRRCPGNPTVYIYISSKYNKEDAPAGHENWYVMINAPYLHGQDWQKQIASSRAAVIEKIKRELDIDVENHIVYEELLTPQQIAARTGSHLGSLYGISSNNMSAAFLRQGNRSKTFKGLYFTGGSAHPGGGIPLTMLSGRTAAGLILERKG